MATGRIRSLLVATAVAAVLSYGLSGHGLPQMNHQEMGAAGAGLCLLLVAAVGFAAVTEPKAHAVAVVTNAAPTRVQAPPTSPPDRRARASPSALQRFRN